MKSNRLKMLLGLVLVSVTSFADTVTVNIVPSSIAPAVFSPAHFVIHEGDTVEFVNHTRGRHTVTGDPSLAKNPNNVVLPAGADPFNSGTLDAGETFTHTFDVAGEYRYICLPHEAMGMAGSFTVLERLDP